MDNRAGIELFDPFAPIEIEAGSLVDAPKAAHEVWEPAPPPGEPPEASAIYHGAHGTASQRWVYRDTSGNALFCVVRFDLPDGRKEVLPYSYGRRIWTVAKGPNAGKRRDVTGWHFKAPRGPRPLFGLERLGSAAPDAAMLVVEGEKTADAAARLFPDMVAITSMGGSKAADKAEWDALAGRNVVIWPDNDQAGQDYAAAVASMLMCGESEPHRALSVRQVSVPPEWGDGWDLADASADHLPLLRQMVDAAETVSLEDLEPDIRPSGFTDEGLALRFSDKYGDSLRYVAGWGRWMRWTGSAWKPDETLQVFDLSRAICRRASSECNNAKIAAILASAKTVAAVERLAKSDRRHAATVDQWDRDPWLLNTPGGKVDLRTGKMRRHDPADHITKTTLVSPGGTCPLWHAFLATATGDDLDLQAYLQRSVGYSLTGSIREHALFFAYGTGANGKGVFLNTVTGILGDYAATAGIETFTASNSDRHPTDLAMLRGARLVTAQETEEGRRWAESRIKSMTGGDPITARFMRQDFFTYIPEFKLMIAGNHRPGLRGVDEAIRRRFHLVPFSVRIPPEERDLDLQEKLKAEWPGILTWAIHGCLEWQKVGLAPPAAVLAATAEYLDSEDAAANWLTECCIQHGTLHVSASDLFKSWREWAEAAGEFSGSQKGFSQKLVAKGFEAKRLAGGKAGFLGIGLKPQENQSSRYGHDD
jgi:putative DNA primase/helicase